MIPGSEINNDLFEDHEEVIESKKQVLLPISEIFSSLQGEGINAGKMSTFIRFFGCNLYCTWCDADYTVPRLIQLKGNKPKFDMIPLDDVIEQIIDFNNPHIVITGGEPLIQKGLLQLLQAIKDISMHIQYEKGTEYNPTIEIETNGTIQPTNEIDQLVDYYDVSPKTNNSLVELKDRFNPQSMRWFAYNSKAFFKFVISTEDDIKEIKNTILDKVPILTTNMMYMPEGIDTQQLLEKSKWLVEVCKRDHVRYSPRLQVFIYGNKRGT